jgi:hypothetical protein
MVGLGLDGAAKEAVVEWVGPGACLSLRAALILHGLPGLKHIPEGCFETGVLLDGSHDSPFLPLGVKITRVKAVHVMESNE